MMGVASYPTALTHGVAAGCLPLCAGPNRYFAAWRHPRLHTLDVDAGPGPDTTPQRIEIPGDSCLPPVILSLLLLNIGL